MLSQPQRHVSDRLILNQRRSSMSSMHASDSANVSPTGTLQRLPSNFPGGNDGGNGLSNNHPAAALDVIEIAWTPITKEVAATISQVLVDDDNGKPPIRIIDLVDNRLGPKLTESIAQAAEASQVEEILVRFNEVGKLGCDAVASVLNVSSRLRHVDLRGNKLGPMDIRKLFRSIAVSQSLQRLGLSNNNLGPEGASLLTVALEKNSFVTHLDMSMNNIGVEGAKSFATLLRVPAHPLRLLNVWGNRLGTQGMEVILDAVTMNTQLTTLSIGNNNAGLGAAEALSNLLQFNTTLQSLEFRSNALTASSLPHIALGIRKNETLHTLQIAGNVFSDGMATPRNPLPIALDGFVKQLLDNDTLRTLDLAGCALGTSGIIRIAGLIAASTTIRELCLSGNEAEDEAAMALAKAITVSKGLQSLDLSGNRFTMAGVSDVLEAVQANHRILHLALQGNVEVSRVVQGKVDALLAERRRPSEFARTAA